jgi:exopolyphosphatase/guanosine-5'-triphosphate,3'-diphosphate pyrophosphatase
MDEPVINKPVKRVTAIDLGTNSFHAVIVDIYPDGSFYTVDKLKEMVLLQDKGMGDRLSDAAFKRGYDALKRIKTLSDHQNSERILAYATSAIREAENGGEFIQKVIDDLGVKISAIPGRIEAELIGLAVQHGVAMPTSAPSLIMDIGGGSVEFILADHEKLYHVSSKKMGVAKMTSRFVKNDPITPEEISNLEDHYRHQLTEVAQSFAMHRGDILIGSSGTMENIALMVADHNKYSPSMSVNELRFTAEEFYKLYNDVIIMNADERRKLKGLDEKRVDLLPAGLVLMRYVLQTFGIKEVKISTQALREGMIIRYINQELKELKKNLSIEDPRHRSVMELVQKCKWHETHSRHVAKMCNELFEEFKDDLGLTENDRELLTYAAYMHDIGYHISHRKHHKHALYLIRNADLKGFTEDEIEIMANVARYHRRSTPKLRHKHYKKLEKDLKKRVKKLSAIMRIADGLDRSHYQNVRSMKVTKTVENITIEIFTEEDPQLEIWGAMRKNLLLEEVTGKDVTIVESETVAEPVA